MSFAKILVANRGDDVREAQGAAKPHRVGREAHAGDFAAEAIRA